jgi:hypothetical protein
VQQLQHLLVACLLEEAPERRRVWSAWTMASNVERMWCQPCSCPAKHVPILSASSSYVDLYDDLQKGLMHCGIVEGTEDSICHFSLGLRHSRGN